MELAYFAGKCSGSMPAVLNAANEMVVDMFLKEKIPFQDIPKLIEKACDSHLKNLCKSPTLEDILYFDNWARVFVKEEILKQKKFMKIN